MRSEGNKRNHVRDRKFKREKNIGNNGSVGKKDGKGRVEKDGDGKEIREIGKGEAQERKWTEERRHRKGRREGNEIWNITSLVFSLVSVLFSCFIAYLIMFLLC